MLESMGEMMIDDDDDDKAYTCKNSTTKHVISSRYKYINNVNYLNGWLEYIQLKVVIVIQCF